MPIPVERNDGCLSNITKKLLTRFLSLFLAVVMVFSSAPLHVLAAYNDTGTEVETSYTPDAPDVSEPEDTPNADDTPGESDYNHESDDESGDDLDQGDESGDDYGYGGGDDDYGYGAGDDDDYDYGYGDDDDDYDYGYGDDDDYDYGYGDDDDDYDYGYGDDDDDYGYGGDDDDYDYGYGGDDDDYGYGDGDDHDCDGYDCDCEYDYDYNYECDYDCDCEECEEELNNNNNVNAADSVWYSIGGQVITLNEDNYGYNFATPLENAMVSLFLGEHLIERIFTDALGQYHFDARVFDVWELLNWYIEVEFEGFETEMAWLSEFTDNYTLSFYGVPHINMDFRLRGVESQLEATILWGDLNGDGVVDEADLELLFMYLAGLPTTFNREAAKVTGGNTITAADYDLLQRYIAGEDVVLGQMLIQPFGIQSRSGAVSIVYSHDYGERGDYVFIRATVEQNALSGFGLAIFEFEFDENVLEFVGRSPRVFRDNLPLGESMFSQRWIYDMMRQSGSTDAEIWAQFPAYSGSNHILHGMDQPLIVPAPAPLLQPNIVRNSWRPTPPAVGVPDPYTGTGLFVELQFRIINTAPIAVSVVDAVSDNGGVWLFGAPVPFSLTPGSVAVTTRIPEVRVVDAPGGNLIDNNTTLTAARGDGFPVNAVITPGAEGGIFNVVNTTLGDVFTASANGFQSATRTLTAAELAQLEAGTLQYIEIVLQTGLQVRVVMDNPDGIGTIPVTSAWLTHQSIAVAGNNTGNFNLADADVNQQLIAGAPGFADRPHNIISDDIDRGYIVINLSPNYVDTDLIVRVVRYQRDLDGNIIEIGGVRQTELVELATLQVDRAGNITDVAGNNPFNMTNARINDTLIASHTIFYSETHTISYGDLVPAEGETVPVIEILLYRYRNADVEVRVIRTNPDAPSTLPVTTASLTVNGTSVTGANGVFENVNVFVGDVLRASAPGFAYREHTVVGANIAGQNPVIYILLDVYVDTDLEVHVVRYVRNAEGNFVYDGLVRRTELVSTSTLTRNSTDVPGAGGIFVMDNARINNNLFATAPGFTGQGHRIVPEDFVPAYGQTVPRIVINLSYGGYEEVTVRVSVTDATQYSPYPILVIANLATAGLPAAVVSPGIWDVTVRGDQIGTVLTASAPGFATVPRTIADTDLAMPREIEIPLNVGPPFRMDVFVEDSVGNRLSTATLTHPNTTPVRYADGHFHASVTAEFINTVFTAGAYGFVPVTHLVTVEDLGRGYITITLDEGYLRRNVPVRVYRQTPNGNVLLPSATLAGVPESRITANNDGTFVVGLYGSDIGTASLTASAAGFANSLPHAITAADLDGRTIVIVMNQGYVPVTLNVLVANRVTPTVALAIATLEHGELTVGGSAGNFTVTVTGEHIDTVLAARATGFVPHPYNHVITPQNLANPNITILLDEGVGIPLIVNVIDGNGDPVTTSTLTRQGIPVLGGVNGTWTIEVTGASVGHELEADAPGFNPVTHEITEADLLAGTITIELGTEGYQDVAVTVNVVRVNGEALPTAYITFLGNEYGPNSTFTLQLNGSHFTQVISARAPGFAVNTHTIIDTDLAGANPTITIVLGVYPIGGGYEYVDVTVRVENYTDPGVLLAIANLSIAGLTQTAETSITPGSAAGEWIVRVSGEHVGQNLRASASGFHDYDHSITVNDLANETITIRMIYGDGVRVRVYVRDHVGNILPTATVVHENPGVLVTPITGSPGVFEFLATGALADTVLTSSAAGFADADHTITHANIDARVITINMTQFANEDVAVRVYRELANGDRVLLPTAELSGVDAGRIEAHNNGTFTVALNGEHIGTTLTAVAPGFSPNTHVVVAGDLEGGPISIVLVGDQPVTVTVSVYGLIGTPAAPVLLPHSNLSTSLPLTDMPVVVVSPGIWEVTVTGDQIGATLNAGASGFIGSLPRPITAEDLAAEEIDIELLPTQSVPLVVRVVDSANPERLITTARLSHQSGSVTISPRNTGEFDVTTNVGQVGSYFTAWAPGFAPVEHELTLDDFNSGIITIVLGYEGEGYLPVDVTVRVEFPAGTLLPTATLAGAANYVDHGDGTFTITVYGYNVGDVLTANAPGFLYQGHTITFENLDEPRVITIVMTRFEDVTVRVTVVDAGNPTPPLTTSDIQIPSGASRTEVEPGVWDVVLTGQMISQSIGATAPGFAPSSGSITPALLAQAAPAMTIQLNRNGEPQLITINVLNSNGDHIPTSTLTLQGVNVTGANGVFTTSTNAERIGHEFIAAAPGFATSQPRAITAEDLADPRVINITLVYDPVDVTVNVYRLVNDVRVPLPTAFITLNSVEDGPASTFTLTLDGSNVGDVITARAPGFAPALPHTITFDDLDNPRVISIVMDQGYEYVTVNVLVADQAAPLTALSTSTLTHSGGLAVGGSAGNFTISVSGQHIGTTLDAEATGFAERSHTIDPQDLLAGNITILLAYGDPETLIVNVVDSQNRAVTTATLELATVQIDPMGNGVFEVTATVAVIGQSLVADAPGFQPASHPITAEDFDRGTITIVLEDYEDVYVTVRVEFPAGTLLPTATLAGAQIITDHGDGRFTVRVDGSNVGDVLTADAPGFNYVQRTITFEDLDAPRVITIVMGGTGFEYVTISVTVVDEAHPTVPLSTSTLEVPATATMTGGAGEWDVTVTGEAIIGGLLIANATGFAQGTHPITAQDLYNEEVTIVLSRIGGEPVDLTVYVRDSEGRLVTTAELEHLSNQVSGNGGVFELSVNATAIDTNLIARASGFNAVTRTITADDLEYGSITIVLGRSGPTYPPYNPVQVAVNVVGLVNGNQMPLPTAFIEFDGNEQGPNSTFTLTLDGSNVGDSIRAWAPGFAEYTHIVYFTDLAGTEPTITIVLGNGYVYVPVRVENYAYPGYPLLTSNLALTDSAASLTGGYGEWVVRLTGNSIGTSMLATAPWFGDSSRSITVHDLAADLIVIRMTERPAVHLTVTVVDGTNANALLSTAELTHSEALTIASAGVGTFTLTVGAGEIDTYLTASAPGFASVERTITLADLESRTIQIVLDELVPIEYLEVQVVRNTYNADGSVSGTVLVSTATLHLSRGDVTFPAATGIFNLDGMARINDVLTASATGFNNRSHTITPENARDGLIVINLSTQDGSGGGYTYIEYLEVQVVRYQRDADGEIMYVGGERQTELVSTATLNLSRGDVTFPAATGVFNLDGMARINDVLFATAPGFTGRSHTIVPTDVAATGQSVITINISYNDDGDPGYVPVEFTVDVRNAGNNNMLRWATLTRNGVSVPRNADGTFTVSAYIHDVLLANNVNFLPGTPHAITVYDAAAGAITLRLHSKEITVDVGDDGDVTVGPPGVEYDPREDGPNIIIVFPPGTDRDNIEVERPSQDWGYNITVDDDGYVTVTITPPVVIPPPPPPPLPPLPPSDPGTPYRPPVVQLDALEVDEYEVLGYAEFFNERFMMGYPDGTFRPMNSITRAEATAFLVRTMLDEFSSDVAAPSLDAFSDVAPGSWYHSYVAWAYNHGLVKGYPDGTFQPNNFITREEFAAIVARGTSVTAGSAPFADAAEVSYWAQNYVNTAFHAGWMVGDDHGRFLPADDITRAEAAATISRMLDRDRTTTESLADVLEDVRIFSDVTNNSVWFHYYIVDGSNSYWFNDLGDAKVWTTVVQYTD